MLRSLAWALLLLFSLFWALTAFAAPKVDAATSLAVTTEGLITVTTTIDELNSDGDCSLREAIQAVQTAMVVDACPSGAHTITLPAGRYKLTLGQLHLTGTVTIQGSATGSSILEGGYHRVLNVHQGAIVRLLSVEITKGAAPYVDYECTPPLR